MSARPITGESLAHLQRRAERIGRTLNVVVAFSVVAAVARFFA